MHAWVLTAGDADDEARCLGVAEAVADSLERRRVAPRAPFGWLAPFGPIDPRDAPHLPNSPIAPSAPRHRGVRWPHVVVAAGERAVPYLRRVEAASGARPVTVFLGATLAGSGVADVVWAPDCSFLRGANVIATPTGPHGAGVGRLAAARGGPPPWSGAPDGPRVGVLLGGDPRRPRADEEDVARLVAGLRRLRDDGAFLAAARSPWTPRNLVLAVGRVAHYLWDGQGPDPHISLLAHCEAFVVTADALHLIDMAAATGRPILASRSAGLGRRARARLDRLTGLGVVRPFARRLERYAYPPLDPTGEIARAVEALVATRAVLAPAAAPISPARARETNGPAR
ncbi:ELM1/GtrOC1 family putative glycosyltransferase [Hansschlegelia sp. KR7-227]|uniref:ELM1/GtrOC1 family putative glycosyltransferase n=1 Tax=Hansschlegelia sp. KR7-227 TaxID=3400914 RepID=UPI003C062D12